MNPLDFLKISIDLQISLGCGYTAYMLAYTGRRRSMTDFDRIFSVIAFGSVASFVIFSARKVGMIIYAPLALLISVSIALAWRKYLQKISYAVLRHLNISWADEFPTALGSIAHDTDNYITQIAVQLDDGTWLRCDNTSEFSNSPFGPCVIGEGGDIAIYLTHEELKDSIPKELSTVKDSKWGDRITYIPAAKIKRITMRHTPIVNHLSTEEEVSQLGTL